MFYLPDKQRTRLELILIFTALATAGLFYRIQGYKMVVLYLFYLPVVLSGFFLGRYHAGLLTVFSVMLASVLVFLDWTGFPAGSSPIVIGLTISVWASTLGLTSLLIGTLSDDRAAKTKELHEAYVGVVEVLSRYLQSANPHLKDRSVRVTELSQMVAARMRLSPKQIDNIRVAALLYDIGKIEITTRLIDRAVSTLRSNIEGLGQDTFQGAELIQSLSNTLSPDILPLLTPEADAMYSYPAEEDSPTVCDIPIGAKIIRTVRSYDDLTQGILGRSPLSPSEAISELRSDITADHDHETVNALEYAVFKADPELLQQAQYAF
ncbi:MAG: hypothetical protein GWP14_10790 [Actinobacteria bacterium]|nr:hypothetical protein [Actinomycetota bacterium]